MSKPDGGPAFSRAGWNGGGGQQAGMSLRDWFAGQALVGMTSCYEQWYTASNGHGWLARHSYQIADAMLAERERG